MKKILPLALSIFSFFACSPTQVNPEPNDPNDPKNNTTQSSEKGRMEWIASIEMEEGPHDLYIFDNKLYASRDQKLFLFNLSQPQKPVLIKEYNAGSSSFTFGELFAFESKIYVPNSGDGSLYEFSKDLNFQQKYDLGISSFKPATVLIDGEKNIWVGGSNGSNGLLAKYNKTGSTLTLAAQYTLDFSGSSISSIIEQGSYIIISVKSGDLLSFSKDNISSGPVKKITYEDEAGHSKWGFTLIKKDNSAFWANWGAGFAAADISDPASLSFSKILTDSKFKSQFPNSGGTSAYDVVYNSKYDYLCVANGWAGIFLVKPNNVEQVLDYIDIEYFQNRSIATQGDYIYSGNISGGITGDLKGIKIYQIKK